MNGILLSLLGVALGLVGVGTGWGGIARWLLITIGASIIPPTLCTFYPNQCPDALANFLAAQPLDIATPSPSPTDTLSPSVSPSPSLSPSPFPSPSFSPSPSPLPSRSPLPSPSPSPSPPVTRRTPDPLQPCEDGECTCVDYKCLW